MLDEAQAPFCLLVLKGEALVDVGLMQVTDASLLAAQSGIAFLLHALDEGSGLDKGSNFGPELLGSFASLLGRHSDLPRSINDLFFLLLKDLVTRFLFETAFYLDL